MSILSPLDSSEWFDGKMDARLEKEQELIDVISRNYTSVLIEDPENHCGLDTLSARMPDRTFMTIDLSTLSDGDFPLVSKKLNGYIANGQFAFDGLLLDNIDQINAGADTEDFQTFVWQALKRDNTELGGYELYPYNTVFPFDKMIVAARCTHYPEYLKDKHLTTYILEFYPTI